jgi:uncharacterized protein
MLKHISRQLLVFFCTFSFGYDAVAADVNSYILATASPGGTFYTVGIAISSLAKVRLEPSKYYGKMTLSAISSGGSGANIKLLRDNEAQFAILQGLYGRWAATGTGELNSDGKQSYLRSVSMLWQNVEHMVMDSQYVKTGTVADLRELYGKKFGIGEKNSGARGSGEEIMTKLGLDSSRYIYVHKGYGNTSSAMQNGEIAGMNIPAGPPVSAVTNTYAKLGDKITILDFTDKQLKEVNKDGELWTRFVIAANTYPGQKKDINTIAQPNFLATREDVSREDVYALTRALYEYLGFLNATHSATKAMSLDKAVAGLPVPLHPGALDYYIKKGITVPERLKPKGYVFEDHGDDKPKR